MATINILLKEHNSSISGKSTLKSIRTTNLVDGDGWVLLRGKLVKAANCRHMLPFSARLANQFLVDAVQPPEAAVFSSVRNINNSLAEFYDVLYGAGTFLTESELSKVRDLVTTCGKHMNGARSYFGGVGLMLFKISPKVHYMGHLPEQCELINARVMQCYGDESLVGVICQIWKRTATGNYFSRVEHRTLTKWLTLLFLELGL